MPVFITRISREVVVGSQMPEDQRQKRDLSLTQGERTCMPLTMFKVTQLIDPWAGGVLTQVFIGLQLLNTKILLC